ncbi:MAG: SCO family protein [Alphaproteobacteria bacterium]|nr:SCO family protein [Alphaproteobacteria bacterium]
MGRFLQALLTAVVLVGIFPTGASAAYMRQPESDIDPSVFKLDEKHLLGQKLDKSYRFSDLEGKEFSLGDLYGKPTILVLSYYTCDGACSVINNDLLDLLVLLEEAENITIGKDFNVLTLSFDENDTLETLTEFKNNLRLPKDIKDHWTFAVAPDFTHLQALTKSLGYKYFWSPQDRTFYHPGAFIFLTPKGRVSRVLYALANEAKDIELAVLESKQGQFKVSEIVNYAASLCYSYNYKEGRYTYNIPLFVAVGSLTLGVITFSGSVVFFGRRRKKRLMEGS